MSSNFYAWTTATEFATALGLFGACLGGVLKVAFSGSATSRCERIKCCCGLCSCDRKPLTANELEILNDIEDPTPPDPEPISRDEKDIADPVSTSLP